MAWDNSGTGCEVVKSKDSAASILFAKSGETLFRQQETVITTEYRGLTENKAKSMVVATAYSSYSETPYYKSISGSVYSFTATTGTKTEWSAARADESGQWVATKKETTYSITPSDPTTSANGSWTTTEIDDSGSSVSPSASGVTVQTGYDKQYAYVFSYSNNVLLSTTETTTREHRYLTQAAATAKVSAVTSSSLRYVTLTCTTGIGSYRLQVPSGTETSASANFVSTAEGWTVVETSVTHGYVNGSGNNYNWS